MTDDAPTETSPNPPPGLTVQRRLALAWLALAWERLWSRLWVPTTLLGLFVAIVWLDFYNFDIFYLLIICAHLHFYSFPLIVVVLNFM